MPRSNWESYTLALPLDGTQGSTTFQDFKGHSFSAAGNASISTAQSVSGGSSLICDGAGDYIYTAASNDFVFGTGNFTICLKVRPTTLSDCILIGIYNGGADGRYWSLRMSSSGQIRFYEGPSSGLSSSVNISTGAWYEVTVTRSGSSMYLFIDGTQRGTYSSSRDFNISYELGVGGQGSVGSLNGYIDEVFIVKGVALWTASYTPYTDVLRDSAFIDVGAQIDLPYGSQIGVVVNQISVPYRDATTLKQQLDLPYTQLNRPRAQTDLTYSHAPTAKAQTRMPYGSLTAVRSQTDLLYRVIEALVRNQVDLPFASTNTVSAVHQADLPYWHSEVTTPTSSGTVTVSVNGEAVSIKAIDVSIRRDQYAISASMTLKNDYDVGRFAIGGTVSIVIMGETYTLVVDGISSLRKFNQSEVVISLLSRASRLDAPYASAVTDELTGTYSSISTQMAGAIPLSWNTVDGAVPQAALGTGDSTPLAVIRQLASTCGAVVLSELNGNITVEPAYPVAVKDWSTTTPSFTLLENVDVIELSQEFEYRPGYNSYLVSDSDGSVQQLNIETETETSSSNILRVYQVPWEGDFSFRHTGGNWIQIEDLGIEDRTETEIVEFVAGEASTTYPIYSVTSTAWKQVDLGAVSWEEDGRLTAPSAEESLLEIVYVTKCRKYRARNTVVEQVQFVAEEP